MHSSDTEKLLNDILQEGNYKAFKQDLCETAMRELRPAHGTQSEPSKFAGWKSWALPLAAPVIVLAGMSATLLNRKEAINPIVYQAVPEPLVTVLAPEWIVTKSMALDSTEIVHAMANVETISSQPLASDMLVTSSSEHLAMISTPQNMEVPALNDAELLSLFPDQPVLLAVISSGHKRLVLVEDIQE